MPIWELAPYIVLAFAGLFGLSLLVPPWSDWRYKALGCTAAAGMALIILG